MAAMSVVRAGDNLSSGENDDAAGGKRESRAHTNDGTFPPRQLDDSPGFEPGLKVSAPTPHTQGIEGRAPGLPGGPGDPTNTNIRAPETDNDRDMPTTRQARALLALDGTRTRLDASTAQTTTEAERHQVGEKLPDPRPQGSGRNSCTTRYAPQRETRRQHTPQRMSGGRGAPGKTPGRRGTSPQTKRRIKWLQISRGQPRTACVTQHTRSNTEGRNLVGEKDWHRKSRRTPCPSRRPH